jgi:hypothetical protein
MPITKNVGHIYVHGITPTQLKRLLGPDYENMG